MERRCSSMKKFMWCGLLNASATESRASPMLRSAFTISPEERANSPCASCDAKLLGFAVCDAKPPASRNRSVKPTDIWLATTGDEIPKLSEIWNRSLFSESTYREDLTDRVRSAVRRRRSFATTFSSKIGLFGSEFHPCNYPWQFRHCDDTKNCAPICIRSPGHVSRETRQNWKIFQRNVSRGT